MSVIEICCPNCGSPSIKKTGSEYCCDNCGRYFQVITTPKKETNTKIAIDQRIKYGKATFNTDDAKKLENFSLTNVMLAFNLFQVFKFHTFKQIKRGNTIVKADIRGYIFTNPLNGIINHAFYSDNGYYPSPNDFKDNLPRECIRIINDNALEDEPSIKFIKNLTPPQMVSGDKIQQDVFNWLTNNLAIKKKYTIQSAQGYDSGIREATFTFKKKDILEFESTGVFAVPLFHLTYRHPNSEKTFKRDYLGYSGELVLDELKCSKTKFLGGTCEDFPTNICAACQNLICQEHTKKCEKCGATICKDCIISKGLISKHYYCQKCT
ncbi:MAG: hypothetical protein NWF01_07920 [Candidatus Bathyarchaeota archaeon]|nr:hypothetical protein [Candidatus Bathyarchaeota archaeon]